MSQTDQDQSALEDPFSLTLDDYGRLWLHTKLNGVEVAIDLADRDVAFNIMAEKMAVCGFDRERVQQHEAADNDDQPRG